MSRSLTIRLLSLSSRFVRFLCELFVKFYMSLMRVSSQPMQVVAKPAYLKRKRLPLRGFVKKADYAFRAYHAMDGKQNDYLLELHRAMSRMRFADLGMAVVCVCF